MSIKPVFGRQLDRSHSLTRNLVRNYLFNEGTGDKIYDLSGNGNHGTLQNMAVANWVGGRDGFVLDFDGSDDFINAGTNTLPLTLPFTISCLVFIPTVSAVNRNVISQGHWNINKSGFWLNLTSVASSKIIMALADSGGSTDVTSNTVISANTWTRVVVVCKSDAVDFYIGNEVDSVAHSQGFTASTNHNLFIGSENDGSNGSSVTTLFEGKVSDIFVWNRGLFATEALQLQFDPYQMVL